MQLSGAVQKARAESQRGRNSASVPDRNPQSLQSVLVVRVRRHVRHQCDVVAALSGVEVAAHRFLYGACGLAIDADRAAGGSGLLVGQRAVLLEAREHPVRVVLGLLHVGLVERVDVQ